MDKTLEQSNSDAETILACLGPLAVMVIHADRMAGHGITLAAVHSDVAKKIGRDTVADSARILKSARERIDAVLQDLGDYFNNHDACSKTMTELSGPVFDVLRKRRDGVSLND